MEQLKKRKTTEIIGNATFTFISHFEGAEILDTEIGNEYLCTIAGCDKPEFIKDLTALIKLYSI